MLNIGLENSKKEKNMQIANRGQWWAVWLVGFMFLCWFCGGGGENPTPGIKPFVIIILGSLYFIPSIIANSRKHLNKSAIICLNLFLGWTFIGWVVALVWAFSSDIKKEN